MVDIFQEVEEDLRAEKLRRVATRYGAGLFAVVIVIVGAAGAWQGWRWWHGKQAAQAGETYVRALELTQRSSTRGQVDVLDPAIAAFDRLVGDAPKTYESLASLNSAALKADKSGGAAGLNDWNRVANDNQERSDWRQLATLLWAAHQTDDGDPAQIRPRLEALVNGGSPWAALAVEQLALLNLREGQIDLAFDRLKTFGQDSTLAPGLNGRVSSLIARFGK